MKYEIYASPDDTIRVGDLIDFLNDERQSILKTQARAEQARQIAELDQIDISRHLESTAQRIAGKEDVLNGLAAKIIQLTES